MNHGDTGFLVRADNDQVTIDVLALVGKVRSARLRR